MPISVNYREASKRSIYKKWGIKQGLLKLKFNRYFESLKKYVSL